MPKRLHQFLPKYLVARRTAQRREWTVQAVASVLAVTCIAGAGLLLPSINEIRKERQLVIDPSSLATLPPDIALLGKLGTFRALAIDWAAIRSENMKDEGKFYEAMQLHKTVCALAPRFPNVWVYAAWNMAYNISVSQYTPEARWQWVQNGIKILRDEGMKYNPRSVTLYKELSWIYWNKIGDFLDDEHLNYKRALAVEMERVLGPPPVTVTDEEYYDWFREIVDAPHSLPELFESHPEVMELVESLRVVGLDADEMLLDFVARNLRPELRVADLQAEPSGLESVHARRMGLLKDPRHAESLGSLLGTLRSQVLRERYKFDLDWMLDLMVNQYGPLDWRHPSSHSLYWASWGDKFAEGHVASNETDAMNTARFVFFSLHNLIMRGRLTLWPDFDDPFSSYIELTPDTRYIPFLYDTYLRLGKKHFGDDPRYVEGTPGPNFMVGFITSMHNWIELLYLEGGEENRKQAENFYAWLRDNNPEPDGSTQERYLVTLDVFVMGDLLQQLQTYRAATAIIGSFVRQGLKQFSLGQMRQGMSSMTRARYCYEFWMADTAIDFNDRRKLQPPELQLRDQIESFMQVAKYDPLYKARLWRELPLRQRQMTYDRLRPLFERICETQDPPWSKERAFPEPAGMEEARQRKIDFRGLRREDIEQGERYRD